MNAKTYIIGKHSDLFDIDITVKKSGDEFNANFMMSALLTTPCLSMNGLIFKWHHRIKHRSINASACLERSLISNSRRISLHF